MSGVACSSPGAVSDAIRAVRTAPGGRGKDAMMCTASATARWRGEPAVGAATVGGPVAPARGPACRVPQPDSAMAAHAAALLSKRGPRCWHGRAAGRAAGEVVMPVRRIRSGWGCVLGRTVTW